jgi:hypothetical protein
MGGYVDPRELTAGYAHAQGKGVSAYWGVLRDGSREVWRCSAKPGHRPHVVARQAGHCAGAELERRLQGAQEVLEALHCAPCGVFTDLGLLTRQGGAQGDAGSFLMRGQCPACTGPAVRVRLAVLERTESSAR